MIVSATGCTRTGSVPPVLLLLFFFFSLLSNLHTGVHYCLRMKDDNDEEEEEKRGIHLDISQKVKSMLMMSSLRCAIGRVVTVFLAAIRVSIYSKREQFSLSDETRHGRVGGKRHH